MNKKTKTKDDMVLEIEDLRIRIEELEETLRAIRSGEVDAMVVLGPEGEQIYTLKDANQPYRVLVETMNEGTATVATDGTILYSNTRLSTMLKMLLEQLIGTSMRLHIAESDRPIFDDLLKKGLHTACKGELSLKSGEGTLPVLLSLSPVRNDSMDCAVIVIADLTKQKKTEEALRKVSENLEVQVKERTAELQESERRYRSIIELSPDAIAIHSEGRYLFVNPAAARLFGAKDPNEIIGKRVLDLVHPRYRELIRERIKHIEGKKERTPLADSKILRLDGSAVDVEASAAPITYSGKPATQVIIRDISERKKAEKLSHGLNNINELIHSTLDFDTIMSRVVSEAAKTLECETAAFSLRTDDSWTVSYAYGFSREVIGTQMNDKEEPHAVLVIKTKNTIAINDAYNDKRVNRDHMKKWGVRSVMVVPVVAGDETMGVLFFNYHKDIFNFQESHIDFANKLGSSVSLAIQQARLFEKLRAELAERKLAEEALRKERDFIAAVLDTAGALVLVLDKEGRIARFNKTCEVITGYSATEVAGRVFWEFLVPPEELNGVRQTWEALHRGNFPNKYENRWVARDGSQRLIAWSNTVIVNPEGELDYIIATGIDITEHKIAEEALKENEKMLARSQEIAHLGSWELDLMKNELKWSDEVYRIFGLQPQELTATYEAFLEHVHPEDRTLVDAAYSGSVKEGKDSYEIEHRIVKKGTGEIRWVYEKCQHVQDAKGKIIRSLGMVQDITERKYAEEKLLTLTDELKRSNADLKQFASVASHDLQEPLQVIKGFLGLMERRYKDKLDEKAHELIRFSIEGAMRMQELIKDLLEYSRVGTKGKAFKPTDCSLILNKAISNLKVAIEESRAEVTHDSLPTVMANGVQLTSLFQNLIGNAIKFHGAEAPRVHISAERKGDEWIFSVRDNGIGIEPKFADTIFAVFQRLHSSDKYPGTGIGLAVCKKIVDLHDGRIWVESKPGRGATFYFTIPERQAREGQ
jgi:PAS domain S-box-containing protein